MTHLVLIVEYTPVKYNLYLPSLAYKGAGGLGAARMLSSSVMTGMAQVTGYVTEELLPHSFRRSEVPVPSHTNFAH